jgi:hypothetical protein
MIEFLVPGSPSVIARATHIFLVQILAVHAGPWAPDRPPTEKRAVELSLRIERLFKGETDLKAGESVAVTIEQWRGTISRQFKLPGPWSGKGLDAGTKYVVFVAGTGGAAGLLRDPVLVLSDAQALADVELADAEDSEKLSVAVLLEKALGGAAKLGFLFPDYLLDRHGTLLLVQAEEFEPLARLFEAPKLTHIARNALLQGIGSAMDQDRAAPGVQDRFIRALFRVLALPEAAPFAENIVDVYLPNRIERRPAWLVYRDAAKERAQAQQIFSARRGPAAEAIRAWLAVEPEKKR